MCPSAALWPTAITQSAGGPQDSPRPKASGPEGRDPSVTRRLAARALYGPPAGIGGGHPPRRWLKLGGVVRRSGRLQRGALRHLPVRQVAPERDQQAAGEGDDRDPADPPALVAHARPEPAARRALG